MALHLIILTILYSYLCNATLSLDTRSIAFADNAVSNVKFYIYVVNPSNTRVLMYISAPRISSFPTRKEQVEPKNSVVIEINTADFEIVGTGKTDKGILIQSDSSELYTAGLSTAYNSADMYLARGATQIGTTYGVLTHCGKKYVCQFTVISLEDNTVIGITFPGYYSASFVFEGKTYGPGDVMTLTLQESQTFQIQSTSDLSGVKILSTNGKRFSVLSGSALTNVNPGDGRDHIADMVPPITAWEKEYILVRRNLVKYPYDQVKLLASGKGANVSIIGCGPIVKQRILGFQTYVYNMTCERVHFISDKAVLIAHFPVSVEHGDAAMFFPTPLHYYVSEYSVYIPPGFKNCAIALVMETMHSNTSNLSKISSSYTPWTEISQSKYSTAWLNNLNTGIVAISHISSFGGHLICEREWSMIALTIGIGNLPVTLREPQEYSTPTIARCSMAHFHDTSRLASSTKALHSSWSTTETPVISNVTSTTPSILVSRTTTGTRDITALSNTTGVVTNSQTDTFTNKSMFYCRCCKSAVPSTDSDNSSEELFDVMDKLKRQLTIPKKDTSKYVRTLVSARDNRTSSAAIGALGIVVLCAVFGSIITIDLVTLFQTRR